MKTKIKIYQFLLVVLFGLTSCSRTEGPIDNPGGDPVTVNPVNDFVWKGLNSWYYWQTDVPNLADNAFKDKNAYAQFINGKQTEDLFYGLLNNYPNTDRFSWIVSDVDELLNSFQGISKSSGMDYSLFGIGDTGVGGIVNYVVPDSPAANAGVKRGDFIFQVDGVDMNRQNYGKLQNDQFSITLAHKVTLENNHINVDEVETMDITSVELHENPVAFYKTFTEGGKKVGYLVYNGFQSSYNSQLNAAFAKMKTDGVTDLILDLRYNGGGSVGTAVALGQMVTGQFSGKPFVYLDFNNKHSNENSEYNLNPKMNTYNSNGDRTGAENINSLNLNKLYVLTTGGTASASELTIDGLRAYMNVQTIGETTYGKFVGSITLFDDPKSDFTNYQNKRSKWAMQPITFAYYNGMRTAHPTPDGENKNGGIVPDYEIGFFDYLGTMKEFGERSDLGLDKALQLITGTTSAHARQAKALRAKMTLNANFIGTNKTLSRFGTEVYLEHPRVK